MAGRVDEVHVLGVLHKTPTAITRVSGAITRYDPDVVAIEATADAIGQYHPDQRDAAWPPRDELEAAAYATAHDYDLCLAGIGAGGYDTDIDFERLDTEIFTDLGILDPNEELTLAAYYELDLPTIREWRRETRDRAPEAYEAVIGSRDVEMAGYLQALADHNDIDTVVAAVGVQHLTGVLGLLHNGQIPPAKVTSPPIAHYRLFSRDSPHSRA
ncbi:TraB/GumN family protein [Halobellus ordinarius]|uniref:TraB/GumN family protein n=1 Tax=Halobellus ordinarius TaxID=3075120 RepID=UPI0028800F10|nr:TraB/GumN family protein [Halobellus sp. ZY16]